MVVSVDFIENVTSKDLKQVRELPMQISRRKDYPRIIIETPETRVCLECPQNSKAVCGAGIVNEGGIGKEVKRNWRTWWWW